MKRIALLTLLAAGASAALAQNAGFVDRARVLAVEPQYESVQVPRNECSSQWVTEARPVAGGILGNQVGKGHGREAATAAGAVIGALAGDRIANNQQPAYQESQREVRSCRTVHDVQNRLTGYRVTYEYRGHQYATVTREQPGQSLPVRVSVTPVEEREYHRPY